MGGIIDIMVFLGETLVMTTLGVLGIGLTCLSFSKDDRISDNHIISCLLTYPCGYIFIVLFCVFTLMWPYMQLTTDACNADPVGNECKVTFGWYAVAFFGHCERGLGHIYRGPQDDLVELCNMDISTSDGVYIVDLIIGDPCCKLDRNMNTARQLYDAGIYVMIAFAIPFATLLIIAIYLYFKHIYETIKKKKNRLLNEDIETPRDDIKEKEYETVNSRPDHSIN